MTLSKGRDTMLPKGSENPKLKTGLIEVHAEKVTILNRAATPPFEISDNVSVTEETMMLLSGNSPLNL